MMIAAADVRAASLIPGVAATPSIEQERRNVPNTIPAGIAEALNVRGVRTARSEQRRARIDGSEPAHTGECNRGT